MLMFKRIEREDMAPRERYVLDMFNSALEALCQEYGVELQHEDSQGAAFLVLNGKPTHSLCPSYLVTEEPADTERAPPAHMSPDVVGILKDGGILASLPHPCRADHVLGEVCGVCGWRRLQ
jgi:hypothetical protein